MDLTDANVGDGSAVTIPCRKLILCMDNKKKKIGDWAERLKNAQNREHFKPN